MVISLEIGGPIGLVKVAFGSDPWSGVLTRRQSQSDDPVFRARFEKMEGTRLRDAKSKVLFSIIFGGTFFFLSLGLFIWLFFRSTGQLRIIYSLGILLALAVLTFAFAIRNDPFGSG